PAVRAQGAVRGPAGCGGAHLRHRDAAAGAGGLTAGAEPQPDVQPGPRAVPAGGSQRDGDGAAEHGCTPTPERSIRKPGSWTFSPTTGTDPMCTSILARAHGAGRTRSD